MVYSVSCLKYGVFDVDLPGGRQSGGRYRDGDGGGILHGRRVDQSAAHPTPYTVHFTPFSLRPTPSNTKPAGPQPETLHPKGITEMETVAASCMVEGLTRSNEHANDVPD